MTTETTTGMKQTETDNEQVADAPEHQPDAAELLDKELAADLRRQYDMLHQRAEEIENEAGRIDETAEHLSDAADLLDGELAADLRRHHDDLHERAGEIGALSEQLREAAQHLSDAADLLDEGISARLREGSEQVDSRPGDPAPWNWVKGLQSVWSGQGNNGPDDQGDAGSGNEKEATA